MKEIAIQDIEIFEITNKKFGVIRHTLDQTTAPEGFEARPLRDREPEHILRLAAFHTEAEARAYEKAVMARCAYDEVGASVRTFDDDLSVCLEWEKYEDEAFRGDVVRTVYRVEA